MKVNLNAAVNKAKKILAEREAKAANSANSNICIVTKEFNSQPEGALVIILKELDHEGP